MNETVTASPKNTVSNVLFFALWLFLFLASVFVAFVINNIWIGRCVDYGEDAGIESFCETYPALGWSNALIIWGLCAVVGMFSLFMLLRTLVKKLLKQRNRFL